MTRDEVSGHASVTAVVLAAMGGTRLERSLASVEWARERIVFDPAARVDGRVPSGVRYVARAALVPELGSAEWLLLLLEGETASPRLADALGRAAADATATRAFAVPVEVRALGTHWIPRPPVRVAPRAAAALVVRDGRPELAARGLPLPLAGAGIVVEAPSSLERAVQALDAESAALAAWVRTAGVRIGVRHLLLPPLASAGRVLLARGHSTRPWARWVAAVFAGYRALLVPAKVWELRQRAAVEPPAAGGA